jgi:protein subunit release factor A
MTPSTLNKLEVLSERLEELSSLLADAGVIADQERFRNICQSSNEHRQC